MIEQFKNIYNNRKVEEIIPFLKQLTTKEKKELGSWLIKERYDSQQREKEIILWSTVLVCCNFSQVKKRYPYYFYWDEDLKEIEEVLEWNLPDWFSDYFNQFKLLPYPYLVKWQQKRYYTPTPERIANSLSYFIEIKELLPIADFPIILQEHIWYLFEYNLFYTSEELATGISKFAEEGLLSKKDILKAALTSSTKNLQKNMYNWIAGLIKKLDIPSPELLPLQEILFDSLQLTHTQFRMTVMDEIKKIIPEPAFQANCLIEALALLLSGTIKKINQTGLQLAELVAKHHPEQKERCCEEIAILFLNKDESIQTKTAKIILRYGSPASEKLRETMKAYQGTMLNAIKQQLERFIPEEDQQEECIQKTSASHLLSTTGIVY